MKPILCLILLFSCGLMAQQRKNKDSLLQALPNAVGKEKVFILQDLTLAHLGIDKNKTLLYAGQALEEAERLKNDSLIIAALNYMSAAMENYGDYQSSLQLNVRAAGLARKTGDRKQLVAVLGHQAINYFQMHQLDKVIPVVYEGLELARDLKDTIGMINMMEMRASTYKSLKNYELAEKYWKEEIELVGKANRYFELGRAYVNMGVMYGESGRFKEAIESYEKGLAPFRAMNYASGLAIIHVNLGDGYLRLGNYTQSKENYQKALELNKTVENPSILGNIKAGLGRVELENGNYELAKGHLLEAEKLGISLADYELLKGVYNYLEGFYIAQHDFRNAVVYHDKYTLSADSLLSRDVVQKISEVEVKYETAKKDKEIAEQQNQLFRQRAWLIGLFGGLGFFLLMVVLLWRNNRERQRANALLVQQKDEIQKTLSELRSTQSQLVQREKMASLGELTAGIAHEIQNPLNFVNNFSEVNTELIDELEQEVDKGNLDEVKSIAKDIKENEQKINHHGNRADAIVKGMLLHSQNSSGVKESTDINKLADEYLRLAYHGLRAKDKSFNPTVTTDFDKTVGNIHIIPQDIGRVILNLLTNAFYAVDEKTKQQPGGYKSAVSVSTRKVNGKVEISVKDNGNGIPQKVVDKIFQPFFTTKPTGQGTGLGLSLSYDIIKAHGGEIKVNTKENDGTEFTVTLPL